MRYILDTNIIIRFLANDHPEHSLDSYRLFEKASKGELILLLDPIIITECVHVLKGKYYQLSREKICELLTKIIEFTEVESDQKDVTIAALVHFSVHNVDYPDAYLAATAEKKRLGVLTFNTKDFKKMGVRNFLPSEI